MSGDMSALAREMEQSHLYDVLESETGKMYGTPRDEGCEQGSEEPVVFGIVGHGVGYKLRARPKRFLELVKGAFVCDGSGKVREHLSPEDQKALLRRVCEEFGIDFIPFQVRVTGDEGRVGTAKRQESFNDVYERLYSCSVFLMVREGKGDGLPAPDGELSSFIVRCREAGKMDLMQRYMVSRYLNTFVMEVCGSMLPYLSTPWVLRREFRSRVDDAVFDLGQVWRSDSNSNASDLVE